MLIDLLELEEDVIGTLRAAVTLPVESYPNDLEEYITTRMASAKGVWLVQFASFDRAPVDEATQGFTYGVSVILLARDLRSSEPGRSAVAEFRRGIKAFENKAFVYTDPGYTDDDDNLVQWWHRAEITRGGFRNYLGNGIYSFLFPLHIRPFTRPPV